MEYKEFLIKRNLDENDLKSINFSKDLNIYNLLDCKDKLLVVNHFPNISNLKNLLNEKNDVEGKYKIQILNINETKNGVIVPLYVLLTDNDEIFINYDKEFMELEEELLKIGRSIFRDYLPIWSKSILSLYFNYRDELKGALDSDIKETRFFEFLKFNFIIYNETKDNESLNIHTDEKEENNIVNDESLNIHTDEKEENDIVNDESLNIHTDEKEENNIVSIELNPVAEKEIMDDLLRIVLDPELLKNIDSKHKNSWIKISNPSYLIYPYYDKEGFIIKTFEERNHIYKENKFSNAIPPHFQNHPDRFLKRRINTGYFNFLWIPKNFIDVGDGRVIPLKDIPNNEGNLQIVNRFPNDEIIHESVFYGDLRKEPTEFNKDKNFLRPGYLIRKGENPEPIFEKIKKSFNGLWSVKIRNIDKNFIYRYFDNFDKLQEYVISLQEHKDNKNGIIIDKYEKSPLLYQGRKFSVQVNVLITNDKNLFIHPFIQVSTSSERYTNTLSNDWEQDKFIYIPREYIQTKSPNFGKYEEGNIISVYDISDDIYSRFFPQWKSIILKCYEKFKNKLETSDRKYFELLGFIFDIDDDMNTYLNNISVIITHKQKADWATNQFKLMFNDMFKIVLDPFYNLKNVGNSWIKVSEPVYTYYIDEGSDLGPTAIQVLEKRKNFISGISKNINDKQKWKYIYDKIVEGDWNLLWFITEKISIEGEGKKSIFTLPNPKNKVQIVNHLPNISYLTNKVNLTQTLTKIQGSDFFYPKTFIYDTKDEFIKTKLIKFMNSISPNFAIVKPGNLHSGQDIRIFDNTFDIVRYIEKNEKHNQRIKGVYIVQEYINNPLLYQGRKFDIRVYVLITDDYDIYINSYGYIRTSSEKYTYKIGNGVSDNWEKDKFVHITNIAVQKYSKNFGKYEKDNYLPLSTEIDGVNIFDYFFPVWKEIINLILLNIKNDLIYLPKELNEEVRSDLVITNRKKYFELLGFDFMVDDNLNTKLLEININPGPTEFREKKQMVNDLMKICVDPLFGINIGKYENSWIKI